MRRQGKPHTPEKIIRKLREAEGMSTAGKTIGQVVQALEISEQTFHRWRNQYGGTKAKEAKRLKELEQENIDMVWAKARARTVGGKVVPTPWLCRLWNYREREGMAKRQALAKDARPPHDQTSGDLPATVATKPLPLREHIPHHRADLQCKLNGTTDGTSNSTCRRKCHTQCGLRESGPQSTEPKVTLVRVQWGVLSTRASAPTDRT